MPVYPAIVSYDHNGIAFLGDSRIAQIFADTGTQMRKTGYNFFSVGNALMGQRLYVAGQFGVSGLRSDQYLAASYTSQAFATKAYWLMIYGIVNDISQNGNSVDYWNTYVKPVVVAWTAQGRKVILPTETGSTSMSSSSTNIGAIVKYNRQIRQYAQENPNVVVFDHAAAVMDPTQTLAFKSGYSSDGTHVNMVPGAFASGQAFANLMSPLVPAVSNMVMNKGEVYANGGVQWFPNPTWQTTSGGTSASGISGTIPSGITGWPGLPSGWSCAVSTTAGPYGNDLVLAITAPGAGTLQMQMDLTGVATENVGDIFTANCEVAVASGSTSFQYPMLHLESNRGGVSYMSEDGTLTSSNGNFPSTAQTLDLQLVNQTIQSGARGWLTGYLYAYFSGAGSATLNIRRMAFWRRQVS